MLAATAWRLSKVTIAASRRSLGFVTLPTPPLPTLGLLCLLTCLPNQIMEICYQAGVKTVTVYAFSIENFNRPKYEVEGLMQLAKVKLEQLTTYGDILDRYGASVRVLGQRELVREDVLQVVDKAMARTRFNTK